VGLKTLTQSVWLFRVLQCVLRCVLCCPAVVCGGLRWSAVFRPTHVCCYSLTACDSAAVGKSIDVKNVLRFHSRNVFEQLYFITN